MKKLLSLLLLSTILVSGPLSIKKSEAIVSFGLIASGLHVVGGIMLATGISTLVVGTIGSAVSFQGDIGSTSGHNKLVAYTLLFTLGAILLPANGQGAELLPVENQAFSSHLADDLEVYNYWSGPLSLRSRAVQAQANFIIQNESDKSLYDTNEEVTALTARLWDLEMDRIGISDSDRNSIKNIFAVTTQN